MSEVKHSKLRKKALPRTGRALDVVSYTDSSNIVSGGGSTTGVRLHTELGGVVTSDSYLITDKAIHLTPETLKEIEADIKEGLRITYKDGYLLYDNQKVKAGFADDFPDEVLKKKTFKKGLAIEQGAQTDALQVTGKTTTDTLEVANNSKTKDLEVSELARARDLVVTRLAEALNLSVTDVATLAKVIVKEYASSETFIPGFAGSGFKIWKLASGEWTGEFDSITIRKTLVAFELLISKIRAVNGALAITQGNGKIKKVLDQTTVYSIEIEDVMSFAVGDLVRHQTWQGVKSKYYWVTVNRIEGNSIICAKAEFNGVVPSVGDELVQIGNASNAARQNMIYLDASSGRPTIDVLSGINTKSLAGKLKVRVGDLSGITDTDFPSNMQPAGDGIYCANGFFKGLFVLRSGRTVEDVISDAQSAADRANTSIVQIEASVKTAKATADKAQEDANAAKSTADTAANRLTAWASDGTISPTEKLALKQEQNALHDERLQIIADAAKYSVSSTAFSTAHTNYNAELTYHTTATPENIVIRATFNTYQSAYYTAKQAVLNAIATAAKKVATDAQSAADRANTSIVQINTELSAIPGLITLAVNAIQVGGRNLLSDTADRDTPFSATGNYAYLDLTPSVKIKQDTSYTFSIDKSEILKGASDKFSVVLYDHTNAAYSASFIIPISSSRIVMTARTLTDIATNANIRVLIYSGIAGATAGKQLKLTNFKLEEGNKATAWSPSPEEVSASIKTAKDAADKAQEDVTTAKSTADAAANRLTAWASDGTISPTEKLALKQEQNALHDDRLQIIADAAKYSVSSTAFSTAHTNYNAELIYHTTATPENIPIRATFNTYQTAYYAAKQAVLNAIATAAKSYVDTKSSTEAGNVRTELGSRITATERDIALKVSSDTFNALGQRVSSAETGILQNAKDMALKATKVELEGIDTRLKSAEIKVQPEQINLVVKSPKLTTVTVDALALDVNTYYPVTIFLQNTTTTFNIKVTRGLDISYGKPSWSIHGYGFSMDFEWESNGSGWGSMYVYRTIFKTAFTFTTNSTTYPAGRIGQLANSSQEYIYVRGGSKYDVVVEGRQNVGITLHPTGYSANDQTLGLLGISDIPAIVPDLQQRPTTKAIQEGITVREDIISVFGKDILLKGKVTFEAFNSVTQGKITSAQTDATKALANANTAREAADAVKVTADAAKVRLDAWASDGTISPTEKLALKQEQNALHDERLQIIADAAKYSVSSTAFSTAHTNYNAELTYHTTATPENIVIRATFNTYQTAYYTAKQAVLNAIATAAKKLVTDAQTSADNALTSSRNDIAAKLGYGNYANMVAEAAAGKTIIEGGYIRGDLIEVDTVLAGKIGAASITTGKLNVTTGAKIGKWNVDQSGLYTNVLRDGGQLKVHVSGTQFLEINSETDKLMGMRNDKGTCISLYTSGGTAIDVTAQSGGKAIVSYGSSKMVQRSGETWNAPGVLYVGSKTGSNAAIYFSKIWGEGCNITSTARTAAGRYTFFHNLGHTSYSVTSTPLQDSGAFYTKLFAKTSTYFTISLLNGGGVEIDNVDFEYVVLGRNVDW